VIIGKIPDKKLMSGNASLTHKEKRDRSVNTKNPSCN
jgi:hypothetical protein